MVTCHEGLSASSAHLTENSFKLTYVNKHIDLTHTYSPSVFFFSSSSTLSVCLRAPDGSCILTNSADNVLRVYNLPAELYSGSWDLLSEMVSLTTTAASLFILWHSFI